MISRRKFIRSASGLFVPAIVGLTRKSLCQPLALPPFGAPQTAGNGLVIPSCYLWWKMNEGSGTALLDSSGSGYTGQINGGSRTTCPVSGALTFNGTSSQNANSLSSSVPYESSFSISCWANPANTSQLAFARIMDMHYNSYFCLCADSTGTKFQLIVNDSGIGTLTSSAFSASTWYNLIGTFSCGGSTGTATFYVNGSSVGTFTFNCPNPASSTSLYTGCIVGGGGGVYWNGSVGDIRIFNAVLTAGQIAGLQTQA